MARSRGDHPTDREVDLLVDVDPDRTLLDVIASEQDLEPRLVQRVDVLTESGLSR